METPQTQKEQPRRLFEFLTILVAVLVAGTTLWTSREKVPEWWFNVTLVVLVIIVVVMGLDRANPILLGRWEDWRKERARNKVAQKHLREFRDLVIVSRGFDGSVRTLLDNIRGQYENEIKSQLAIHALSYGDSDIMTVIYNIEKEIDESEGFRDSVLIMREFASVLNIFKKNLKILEVFAHEMMTTTGKPITKGIEADYEAFREKYNDFIKDFVGFCHKVNQETGTYDFPERSFDYLKKW